MNDGATVDPTIRRAANPHRFEQVLFFRSFGLP
jgi:hypothetical protein